MFFLYDCSFCHSCFFPLFFTEMQLVVQCNQQMSLFVNTIWLASIKATSNILSNYQKKKKSCNFRQKTIVFTNLSRDRVNWFICVWEIVITFFLRRRNIKSFWLLFSKKKKFVNFSIMNEEQYFQLSILKTKTVLYSLKIQSVNED